MLSPLELEHLAQVMEDLQEDKEHVMGAGEEAAVAAGLEGAGPSLDVDEELRILEDEAQVSLQRLAICSGIINVCDRRVGWIVCVDAPKNRD